MDKIKRNSYYCIDEIVNDIENLECKNDFMVKPSRKRKGVPTITPVKAKRQNQQKLYYDRPEKREKDLIKIAAKSYIDDEADVEGKIILFI